MNRLFQGDGMYGDHVISDWKSRRVLFSLKIFLVFTLEDLITQSLISDVAHLKHCAAGTA